MHWPLFLLLVFQALGGSSHCPKTSRSREQGTEGYIHRVQPSGRQSRADRGGERLRELKWRLTRRGAKYDLVLKKKFIGNKESIKSLEILSRNYLSSNSLWFSKTPYRNMFLFPKFRFSLLWKKLPQQSWIIFSKSLSISSISPKEGN